MKKLYKVIGITVALIYLLSAPTFIQIKYGSQPESKIDVGSAYAYLWLHRKDSLRYYLFFGQWKFDIEDTMFLMLYDGKSKLKKVAIESAKVIIDAEEYSVPELQSVTIEMDSSQFNGYAGNGSAERSNTIKLPKTPQKSVALIIRGKAITNDGQQPILLTVKSDIVKEEHIVPFFMTFLYELMAT